MEEGLLNMEVTRDPFLLCQDVRGIYYLVLEADPASREYFLDGL
jgi:hypothetical protein